MGTREERQLVSPGTRARRSRVRQFRFGETRWRDESQIWQTVESRRVAPDRNRLTDLASGAYWIIGANLWCI